jgi:hypothetical protein
MNLYDEFSAIVKAFRKKNVRFAIVGGLAMAFHDEPRFTRDIDVLLHSDDEEKMVGALVGLGYFESTTPRKFTNAPILLRRFVRAEGEEFIPVDILVGKTKRMDAIVDNAEEHPWSTGKVKVATREDIIKLKKGRGSDQDIVDIRKLKK